MKITVFIARAGDEKFTMQSEATDPEELVELLSKVTAGLLTGAIYRAAFESDGETWPGPIEPPAKVVRRIKRRRRRGEPGFS